MNPNTSLFLKATILSKSYIYDMSLGVINIMPDAYGIYDTIVPNYTSSS
jgi:hypothetical protein